MASKQVKFLVILILGSVITIELSFFEDVQDVTQICVIPQTLMFIIITVKN